MKNLIIPFILVTLAACSNDSSAPTPEQAIRKTLSKIEEGIEGRSLSQVMDRISDDYNDSKGRLKQDIKRYTQLQILRNQKIHIFTRIKSIKIDKKRAKVEISSAMTSREGDLSIEENRLKADTFSSTIVLNEQDGKWMVTSSNWQRGWLK